MCVRPLARRKCRGDPAVVQRARNAQYHVVPEVAKSKRNRENGATVAVEHGKLRRRGPATLRAGATRAQHEMDNTRGVNEDVIE